LHLSGAAGEVMLSTKPPRCKHCRARTEKPGQVIHEACIDPFLADLKKKQEAKRERDRRAKAKVERAEIRRRKEKLKTRSEWEEECRQIVQKIARIRDRNDGCISCDLPANWDGQWHGSHFRSHGACSVLQFNLLNIHKACWICNKIYSGRINEYEPRLVKKIGQERVDWLNSQNGIFKPPIDYYVKFKRVMGKKLRRMEKRI
jgi:hypothetical protein